MLPDLPSSALTERRDPAAERAGCEQKTSGGDGRRGAAEEKPRSWHIGSCRSRARTRRCRPAECRREAGSHAWPTPGPGGERRGAIGRRGVSTSRPSTAIPVPLHQLEHCGQSDEGDGGSSPSASTAASGLVALALAFIVVAAPGGLIDGVLAAGWSSTRQPGAGDAILALRPGRPRRPMAAWHPDRLVRGSSAGVPVRAAACATR